MKKFLFPIVLILTGCVNLLPPPAPRPQIVPLDLQFQAPSPMKKVGWSLAIDKPLASPPLDTKRLMVRMKNLSNVATLQPLEGIEWQDRLSALIQQHLTMAFEKSQKIMAIGQIEDDFQPDYLLQMDIRKAEIDLVSAPHPQAHFEISVKLIDQKDRKIVNRNTFYQKIPLPSLSQKDFIDTYAHGLEGILNQIVMWTLKN